MRLALIGLPLLAVALACDAAPKKNRRNADASQPLERACTVQDCFVERDVRDFEVLDQTTVIVYIGSQRCAFRIELRGAFCDLTFAPELFFHAKNDMDRSANRRDIAPSGTGNILIGPPPRHLTDLRVCSNDIGISVDGGSFTESPQNADRGVLTDNRQSDRPLDRFGNVRSECQISNVASITDDEVMQLYVDHGAAPPPPMGSGKIEVGEQADKAAPAAEKPTPAEQGGGAAAAPEATAADAAN